MTVPALVDAASGARDWLAFVLAAGVSLFVGGALVLATRREGRRLMLRDAFLLTGVSWLTGAAAAALPFWFLQQGLSFTDAFFESMSGITSTGATVLKSVDAAPPGILVWRAMLNWMGGLAFVALSSSVLPMLHVGGMQIFRAEGIDTPERLLPRTAELVSATGGLYTIATAIAALALWGAGMPRFDAVIHAMTAVSTGGFSSRDVQVHAFAGSGIRWILVVCMIFGSLPFVLYVEALRGRWRRLLLDAQVHGFIGILAAFAAAGFLWLWLGRNEGAGTAIEQSVFAVTSFLSGTGFIAGDFRQWGGFALVILFLLMFVGGCAGSTACGIKVFRFQIAYQVFRAQMSKLVQPHGMFVPYYNRQPVTDDVASAVMGFFFLFAFTFAGLALALAAFGPDLVTSLSAAATILGNVGPAFGPEIGPAGNFASLADPAKWLCAFAMLIGRLEVFTVFVLFWSGFWRA
ncbi:MAG: TrkH family potassium uptake protein [Rhodospirillaceae bacterium]|nr:TrkH family potassium uptake protein [Rhodospirillaceae bacterium]